MTTPIRRRRLTLAGALVAVWLGVAAHAAAQVASAPARTEQPALSKASFAALVERLSEPGGYFDTDNLISNESSYLHAVSVLRRLRVSGGAYIGVGPDQNFSYIAHVRPQIAYIIDIRRDNLLELMLFKSLFALARTRIEYLCMLVARPAPANPTEWESRPIAEVVRYVDSVGTSPERVKTARAAVAERVRTFSVPLSDTDLQTIDRFHQAFIDQGLSLKFNTFRRAPQLDYPDYRRLLLETDREGHQVSYLASEADYQFVRSLQQRNLVVPVVGNLAGEKAMAAIARDVSQRHERVSAFYTSNVEFYLLQDGSFDRFAKNVARLPHDGRSVIIRSYFSYGYPHPQAVTGYNSTQVVQLIGSMLRGQEKGAYHTYRDLVTIDVVEGLP